MSDGVLNNGNSKAAAFRAQLQATQNRFNPAAREQLTDRKGGLNSKFPVTLGDPDKDDDEYRRRAALVDATTGIVPGVGQAVAPEKYFDYIKRKEDMNLYTSFKEWIFNNADLSSPETAAYWTDLFPFIKEKMYEEIDREAELQRRLAKIEAVGAQTEEDWYTLWCLNQGLIKPYSVPLYQMNTADPPYKGGLFSIFNMGPLAEAQTMKKGSIVPFANPLGDKYDASTMTAAGLAGKTMAAQTAASLPNVNSANLKTLYAHFQK